MAWARPAYSRQEVNSAGKTLVDPNATREEMEIALTVVNNWRSSHSFPLNTLQVNLRGVATNHDRHATVAQRIKRLPSIESKLVRMPTLPLGQMQDIGGCRAVVSSVKRVNDVVSYYKSISRMKHGLVREDPYIDRPKSSGYRGVHLVYRYYSDRSSAYNGLKIEMQIRSRLQHAWATAVETVGTFTQQALKSSAGEAEWLRFFAVMSSVFALREKTPTVPGTPTEASELISEVRALTDKLDVVGRLRAYGQALSVVEAGGVPSGQGNIYLLELDIPARSLTWRIHTNSIVAADQYGAIERAISNEPGKDVVLVTAESLDSLRRAYPNYFLDTSSFLDAVEAAIA